MAEETVEKPIVELLQLDRTKVKAPYVCYIDTRTDPHGDAISNCNLCPTQLNKQAIPAGGPYIIEYTIAVLLRGRIPGYIDCSSLGCRTGLHLLTWSTHPIEEAARVLKESLEFIAYRATWGDVPVITEKSYGNYRNHSLFTAKEWAKQALEEGISSDPFECKVV